MTISSLSLGGTYENTPICCTALLERLSLDCLDFHDNHNKYFYKQEALAPIEALSDTEVASLMEHYGSSPPDFTSGNYDKTGEQLMLYVLIAGSSLVRFDPCFRSCTIHLKTEGASPGFILVSPTTMQSYFFKKIENVQADCFNYLCLAYLGVKAPEAKIVIDRAKTVWMMTLGMDRKYVKQDVVKSKRFQTIEDIFSTRSHECAAQNTSTTHSNFAQKILQEYLPAGEKPGRSSFAKVLVAAYIFGLTDVFCHYGNLGFVATTYAHEMELKEIKKFAIIDFNSPNELRTISHTTAEHYSSAKSVIFNDNATSYYHFYKQLFQSVSHQEVTAALLDLNSPKCRQYDCFGHLVAEKEVTTFEEAMEKAQAEFSRYFPSAAAEAEIRKKQIFTRFQGLMTMEEVKL